MKLRARDYAAAIRDLHSDTVAQSVSLVIFHFGYSCDYGVGLLTPEILGEYV